MKSHPKYQFWFLSVLVHLCLAIVLSIIIINRTIPSHVDAFDVSIFKAEPVPSVKRIPNVEAPTGAPIPMPDFQIESQLASARTRAVTTQPVKSASVSVPKAVAVSVPVTRSPAQYARAKISVQEASRSSQVNHQPAQLLATVADIPIQSDAPLAAGSSGNSSLSGSGSIGKGNGIGVGRGTFGLGTSADQTRPRGGAGLTSLVGAEGTASIEDTLSDVTEKVTLGDGVPELPPGSPGAIVMGRGRDIMGRLNLARFEDPLHPSADI
ncbi:hypothetical protein F4X33_19540 [Candidatus Poribacteria bacterium]|nr:hypothetical protein [Candidatus Poribacteria bacterium]